LGILNKIITSPFLPKSLNPYHVNEFYLSMHLNFLRENGFKVNYIYRDKRVKDWNCWKRFFGSLLKFFLNKFSLKPTCWVTFIAQFIIRYCRVAVYSKHLIDSDPSLIIHEEVRSNSNVILYEYS
jgi:hypothetical protein